MKACVLEQTGDISEDRLIIKETKTPKPQSGELLVKVKCCGVCHTDLHTVEGELKLPKKGIIPGHQAIGEIVEIGKGVEGFKIGERVGTTWVYQTCGSCDYCKRGHENLCEKAKFTGLHANGGYSEYMIIKADYAVRIPEEFSSQQAAPLLCAGAIGFRSLRLCEIQPRQKLGLYGFGASAHIAIQVARYLECEVYVFTRGDLHKKHAKDMGAVWTGETTDEPPEKLDGSVIFAPAGEIVHDAMKHLKKGGTLAINAIHMSNIPVMSYQLIYGEKTMRSVTNLTRKDAQELMDLAVRIPVKTDIEIYSLEEANEVLRKLKDSQIRGAAVLEVSK